ILCSQYLHWGATERNENGVFIGMNEPKARLMTEMRDLGMDLASLEKKRQFGYVDATEVRRIPEQARVGRNPVGGKELGLANLKDARHQDRYCAPSLCNQRQWYRGPSKRRGLRLDQKWKTPQSRSGPILRKHRRTD